MKPALLQAEGSSLILVMFLTLVPLSSLLVCGVNNFVTGWATPSHD
jgi:hypothetical protein